MIVGSFVSLYVSVIVFLYIYIFLLLIGSERRGLAPPQGGAVATKMSQQQLAEVEGWG